jgi:hypothetical protein
MKFFRLLAGPAAIAVTLAAAGCGGGSDEELQFDLRPALPTSVVFKDFSKGQQGLAVSEFKSLNATYSEGDYTVAVFNVDAMERSALLSAARAELNKGKTIVLDSDGSGLGKDRVRELSIELTGSGERAAAMAHTLVTEDRIESTKLTPAPFGRAPAEYLSEIEYKAVPDNSIKNMFSDAKWN